MGQSEMSPEFRMFFDAFGERLAKIETKLDVIVRLEEKQANTIDAMRRFGLRLDAVEKRIHQVELAQGVDRKGDVVVFGILKSVGVCALGVIGTLLATKFGAL